MKEIKNDSTFVLSRFGRDRRTRTVTATAERVERRPRLQRDAADSEQPSQPFRPGHRASYNPHFTADNRPRFDRSRQEDEERPRRAFGDRENRYGEERPQRTHGEKPRYGEHSRFDNNDRPRRTFGDHDNRYDEERPRRAFGDKPRFEGDRPRREEGDRPQRAYGPKGAKPGYGDRRTGKFDDRKGTKGSRFGGKNAEGRPAEKHPRKGADKPVSYPKYEPAAQTGEMRLNRFIAQSGICSRREADDFILAGVVTVNGKVVTELGTKVRMTDDVRFNGERLKGEQKVYIVMNKPKGYVTTTSDPHAEKTVMDLLKGCKSRVFSVGRLDKNTTGVLMFTNDGEMAEKLTHPSYNKKKIYQVTLNTDLTQEDYDKILAGVMLTDGEIAADELEYIDDSDHRKLGIEIHSGKNRIVRRIFESLGYEVKSLDRVYFAGLTKKGLKKGHWRYLTDAEVNILKIGSYQ